MDILGSIKNLSSLFKKKEGGVIGLDVGSSSIKVIELQKKHGKMELMKYGTLALGSVAKSEMGKSVKMSPEKQALAVKTILEAVGIKSRRGAISIPLRLSLIVTLNVPAVAKDKLDTVVPLEARKYIPVAPSEVNIAWSIISEDESSSLSKAVQTKTKTPQIKVLAAAIHNGTIKNYQELATEAGLNPVLFEIETFSAIRSVAGDEKGTFALLDIGAGVSKIIVSDFGSITVSHTISKGSEDMTNTIAQAFQISFKDAEILKRKLGIEGEHNGKKMKDIISEDLNVIFSESNQVLGEFENSQNRKIQKIFLIGGGATLKGIISLARSTLGRDVKSGNPFSRVQLPVPALKPVLEASGPEFAVALGLALRSVEEV